MRLGRWWHQVVPFWNARPRPAGGARLVRMLLAARSIF